MITNHQRSQGIVGVPFQALFQASLVRSPNMALANVSLMANPKVQGRGSPFHPSWGMEIVWMSIQGSSELGPITQEI